MKRHEGRVFSWILAILLPILAVFPALIQPVEEHAVDAALFHIYRAVVFSAARADGWFYPRWAPAVHAGLGGPLFSFYPPMLYFLMDALHSLGFAFPMTWRLVVALALVAASTGIFALGLSLFKRADVALACAAIFTYSPYLLRDLFERGSPQGLAIALYPWVLWSVLRLAERPSGRRFALACSCWATTILLHNVAALLCLPVLGLFLIFVASREGTKGLLVSLAALLIGLLLTASYVLPFMAERAYVQLENAAGPDWASPVTNPLSLTELLRPTPVFDTGLANNTTGQTLGTLPALILPLSLVLVVVLSRRKRIADVVLVGGLAAWGLAMLWLQTEAATPVWHTVSAFGILQYLNFRWRLLSTMGLVTVILLGYLLAQVPNRWKGAVVTAVIAAYVGLRLPSLYPELLMHHADVPSSPTVADAQAFALKANFPDLSYFNELLPRWRTMPFTKEEAQRVADTPIANLPEGGHILGEERRTGWLRVEVETPAPFSAVLHVLYFPGWVGYVDEERQPLRPMDSTGYAVLDVPAGTHMLSLRYEGTLAQRVGDAVSGATAISVLLLAVLWRPKQEARVASHTAYLNPRWWVPAGFLLVVGLKALWLDPHTTLLRWSSTCQAIHRADVHTDVRFDERLDLCGYELSATRFHPGDRVRITLFWQLDQAVDEPASSFVHLLGTTFNPETGNPLWGQQDKQMATELWTSGKLYRDRYEFRIAPHTPPGEYQLEIGWWWPSTGLRLSPEIAQPTDRLSVSHLDSLLVSGIEVR